MITYKLYQRIKNALNQEKLIMIDSRVYHRGEGQEGLLFLQYTARKLKEFNPDLKLSILKVEETEISIEGEDQ